MKLSFTLSLFLGLISKDAAALRLQHHHHHHHPHQKMAQYDGDSQAWVDDCQPGRNPRIQADGQAGTGGSYPGVGIECQGFAKKTHKMAQYDGDSQAWVDDCQPGRNPLVQADGQAGTGGSYPGVGVECQGFSKKTTQKMAQYDGDSQDWVDKCDPDQDTVAQKNPSGAGTFKDEKTHGSFPGVGVECQGFAQQKSQSRAQYDGDSQAWVDKCDPTQDTVAQKNPSGAGTYEEGAGGRLPGVGVECQGFAQKKSQAQYDGDSQAWVDDCQPGRNPLVQADGQAGTGGSYPGVGVECQGFNKKNSHGSNKLAQYDGDTQSWIDDCDPGRNPLTQANGGAGVNTYPGVGINCQGFAQKKSKHHNKHHKHHKSHKLVQYDGDNQAWIDACDPTQDTVAQKNPSGAGTYEKAHNGSFDKVGVECMGFAQKKSKSLAQYDGDKQAWVDQCDATQDTVAQKNPSGAGTYEETNKGSFPGVGVECQGFAQKSTVRPETTFHRDCPGNLPDCNGTNGTPGVNCC